MSIPVESAPTRRFSAELGMLVVVLIWGLNFSITKATYLHVTPLAFTAFRFAIASIGLLVLMWIVEPGVKTPKAMMWRLVVIGLIGNTLYQPLYSVGLDYSTASNTAVIIGSLPAVVALMAWGMRVEKVTRAVGVGIAISVIGLWLVVANGMDHTARNTVGDLMTLAALSCWAAYTIGLRTIDPSISPLRVTAITTVAGTPGLILVGLPESLDVPWSNVPASAYVSILYAALFSLVVAYLLFNNGVRVLGASRTSVYSCFVPVVAVLVAWMMLGERPAPIQFFGAALVVLGVWLTRRRVRA